MAVTFPTFFDRIHPPTGWRCLFTLPNKQHYWFQNSQDMAVAALGLDARGFAVFHSCATFTQRERKQEHVASLQCLWFDIDAGPGKAYQNPGAAYRAFQNWRQAAGVPPAVVVASGGGLHVYWPLRAPLDREQWARAAHGLRALAHQHGLEIDAGSTIDSARILRPPGTHNRKILDAAGKKIADTGGEPRPVRCGPLIESYPIEALSVLFTASPAPELSLGAVPAFLKGKVDRDGLLNIGTTDQPSDPLLVVSRCAQLARLRDTRGNLPEPEWYACLGILAHSDSAGRTAAHEWSSGDARYRASDTDAKLEQYRVNAGGPTTCARFAALNPGPCILCKFNGTITSPIQLGRDLPVAATATPPPKLELPVLPHGFRWHGMKLVYERKPTDEDASDHHVISDYPVVVDELQETEKTAKVSAVFRSWEPMRQAWKDFNLGFGELIAQGGAAKVADQGVIVPKRRWEKFIEYVNAMASNYRGSRHYGIRYEQFGWKATPEGPAFALGRQMLRHGTATRIHGNDEFTRRSSYMVPQGSVAAWTSAANKLVAKPGMEAHTFMLLAAFAAPLYHFTGEPGATFVHGVTRGSGKGKTTMLEAGASIYGMPEATSIIERDTLVAKFVTLGTLCNLPVFFDELRFRDPEDTKQYILQGTVGRDKQRGLNTGGLRADQLTWATIHISAANLSVVDTVRADGGEVAQAARIFEFPMTLPEDAKTSEGDALKKLLRANMGTAGPAFIQAVLDNHAWVQQAVPARMQHYEQVMKAGPEERFILRLFACIDVAGALVKKCGLLVCNLSQVMAWAVGVQRGNAGRLATESVVDAGAIVSQMINDLISYTIVMPRPQQVGKPSATTVPVREPHGALKARFEIEGRALLLDVDAVRTWMQEKHQPFSQIQQELMTLGVLKDPRVRRSLAAGSGRTASQVWCWQIDGQHALLQDLIDMVAETPRPESNVVPLRGKL